MAASKEDPKKLLDAGCDRWGTERLALAIIMKAWLDNEGLDWFIESGTLLGAWRSGEFIPHDDDFDIALVTGPDDPVGELKRLCALLAAALPAPYACRVVTSYCDKIEVYDPTQGEYTLLGDQYQGARFHYVTIDLQAYVPRTHEDGKMLIPLHRAVPPAHLPTPTFDECMPVSFIELEGTKFPCPNNTEAFLQTMYGYLGQGARFDPTTGKYLAPC